MKGNRNLRRMLLALLAIGGLVALAMAAPALHLIDNRAFRLFASGRPNREVAAVLFSGDMGLRLGMGPKVAPALAAHGIPVLGVSSSVEFGTHRTQAEAEVIVANAIRTALRDTGARRVVLLGQSFGADVLAATAPYLPPDLKQRVAAIALVVPGRDVFLRADPTGLSYHGVPDVQPAAALRALDWAPVICIRGASEPESLCPALDATRADVITLPGGHFLRNDHKLLTATILRALARARPSIVA